MIIPIKCFCGNVLANKYSYFRRQVEQRRVAEKLDQEKTQYLTKRSTMKKTIEAQVLDDLCMFKNCCRSKMLTHVDIL